MIMSILSYMVHHRTGTLYILYYYILYYYVLCIMLLLCVMYVVLCIVMKMKMKSIDIEFDYDYVSEFRQDYLGNYTIPSHPLLVATSILTRQDTSNSQ